MVNLFKVMQGLGMFLAGTLGSLLLYYIVPTIMEIWYNDTTWTWTADQGTLFNIFWIIILITWVALMILIPLAFIIRGIQEPEEDVNIIQKLVAIALMIIGIGLTVVGWSWITTIATWMPTSILLYIFYAGLICNWIAGIIIAPLTKIASKG